MYGVTSPKVGFVSGSETIPPFVIDVESLCKWKVKIRKAIFVIKTIVEEEMIEHVRNTKTLKEA